MPLLGYADEPDISAGPRGHNGRERNLRGALNTVGVMGYAWGQGST